MSILLADIDATCAALGYSDGEKYQAEPDAIQGLKHLIWILRRDLDNHEYRRHMGHSKVLQTDLVYMLPDYIDQEEYADLLIRLLVILTNPTLLLYRDGPPKDNHGRKIFLELIDILQGYKSAFTRDKVWIALFGKLKQALGIDWATRSEEQSLLIERILVLIRNVLQVPANPEAECRADNDASVHDQVIWALHQSGILDLVLFIISSPDEHQFHLHGLEILCLLYREQTAESLADASLQRSVSEKQRDEQDLIAARRREKARLHMRPAPGRHSRFGGTYVIRNLKSVSDRDIICHQPLERVAAIDFDREKQQQKRSHRHIKEEAQVTRRSAFSVRLCLREYCIEVLRSAYNTLVRQVRRVLERNAGSTSHDDSYLLWAIRFFMEFNRLSGLQLQLVSESLSVQCFHWVLTRIQHDTDMIVSDKKQARLWAKRLHVALQTFRELLESLLALQKLSDDNARALFDMLLNNVCYVLEYRETILHLLMNYNEAYSTKAYLRDVVGTANIFIKMMEKFCKDSVVVQDKKRGGSRRLGGKKSKESTKRQAIKQETEEELANKWAEMAPEMSALIVSELQMPEEDQPIPFDATLEKSIDDQREDCMIRINKLLRTQKLDQAIALLRAAREVWPENDVFGAISAAPEDELLLLREIFMHNIAPVEIDAAPEVDLMDDADEDDDVHNEEMEDNGLTEKTFKFDDFARRLLHPKVVRACTLVLADWDQIPTKSVKASVTILHRIAYGCSCPAMLFQAKLFRIFQQVFHAPRDIHQEELRRLGIFVLRKFVEVAPTNPKIYAELLFYKSIKEANELESGYCDEYETGTKGTWTEEQEAELRFLFEENQRNPESDVDVIDWILENLSDKTRTRRGVLKKLKELGVMFKAPTKKSTKAAANKNQWPPDEDEELRNLYDQYRLEDDCLQRIMREFDERRTKQQIIKRMLQLHMIADKSEILPQKPQRKRKSKAEESENENENFMEEPHFAESAESGIDTFGMGKKNKKNKKQKQKQKVQKSQRTKPKPRKVVRTPLDVGTVRALLDNLDREKFEASIDWLKECLEDAADDADEPINEDDGVPLVPLMEDQKIAMDDIDFQKILVALGIQPPIEGMENYWRIPTYLNGADLQLRAKIVAGESLESNIATDVPELVSQDENEEDSDVDGDSDSDSDGDDDNNETDATSADDSEEDYLEKHSKQQRAHANITENQQEKLNSLMYSKSDDETEARKPLQNKMPKLKNRASRKKQAKASGDEDSENENDLVNEIKRKLDRKKRKPEIASSDDEQEDVWQQMLETNSNKKKPQHKPKPKQKQKQKSKVENESNVDDLFDQLKAKRKPKIKLAEMAKTDETQKSTGNDVGDADSDSELNFNSEDYRKRLLELGDSDVEQEVNEAEIGAVASFTSDEEDKENTITKAKATRSQIQSQSLRNRRANVIDSDSDEQAGDGNEISGDEYDVNATHVSEKTSKQLNNLRKKRPREDDIVEEEDRQKDGMDAQSSGDDDDEDGNFIARKKPTKAEQALIASGMKPAKRRRIAIIDDEEDDDDIRDHRDHDDGADE